MSAASSAAAPGLAAAVALSGLDGMTPARLRSLLRRHDPRTALAVARGDEPDPVFGDLLAKAARARAGAVDWHRRWRDELGRCGVDERFARFAASGVGVVLHGHPGYPECLLDDPAAPSLLFHRGDLGFIDGRRVAVVGTRSATASGRHTAMELGVKLAERGVRVVSGLARGIDGAAHRGALGAPGGAPPIGVVASGLDVVYPREHAELWDRVATVGVLLSERPPGTPPRAGAFPERNRILAALSELVVVVESRATGGSLLTATEATRRDIAVMAVPGSVASRASDGTNQLLRDGLAAVALDPTDVLVALGLDTRRAHRRRYDPRPALAVEDQELLDLIGGDAVTLEELYLRSGGDLASVALRVGRLESQGWVTRSGAWFEAAATPPTATGNGAGGPPPWSAL